MPKDHRESIKINDEMCISGGFVIDGAGSAPFDPSDIAGLVGWFKADDDNMTLSGSLVEGWLDLTGTGDASASSNQRPQYTSSGADGIPAIFEANADWSMDFTSRTAKHVFFKMNMNDSILQSSRFLSNGFPRWQGNPVEIFTNGNTFRVDGVDTPTATDLSAMVNPAVFEYVLTTPAAVTQLGLRPAGTGFSVVAEIAEVLIYDAEITAPDVDNIRSYLAY